MNLNSSFVLTFEQTIHSNTTASLPSISLSNSYFGITNLFLLVFVINNFFSLSNFYNSVGTSPWYHLCIFILFLMFLLLQVNADVDIYIYYLMNSTTFMQTRYVKVEMQDIIGLIGLWCCGPWVQKNRCMLGDFRPRLLSRGFTVRVCAISNNMVTGIMSTKKISNLGFKSSEAYSHAVYLCWRGFPKQTIGNPLAIHY